MSDNKPLSDAPGQQASADRAIAEQQARAEQDRADKQAFDASQQAQRAKGDQPEQEHGHQHDSAPDQRADKAQGSQSDKAQSGDDKTHGGKVNIPSTNPAASNISPSPALPDAEPEGMPGGHTAAQHETAKFDAGQHEEQRPNDDKDRVPLTQEQKDAEAHERDEAKAAEQAEKDKAERAKAGVTGAENGDPAGVAFSGRIDAAKWEHRNQGHDDTMQLIDDLFAALQRMEERARTGGKGA